MRDGLKVVLACLAVVAAGITAVALLPTMRMPVFIPDPAMTEQESKIIYPNQVPAPAPQPIQDSAVNLAPAAPSSATPVMILGSKNTITFRGPVTDLSVSEVQQQLLSMSEKLGKNDVIYLVLDTPGGSIDSGNLLIDTAKSLPQKVKTLTIFAASMGFHIAQNLDERLITPSGTLMSHRAKVGGLGGEIPGELIVRINHILRILQVMDAKASSRMGMAVDKYREMIRDEYWVYGEDSLSAKAADKIVLARCAPDMMGTVDQEIRTFFGNIQVTWSRCPLITAPLKVNLGGLKFELPRQESEMKEFSDLLFSDKKRFVQEYIVDDSFRKYLP